MRPLRCFSLLLSALLQCLPMVRVVSVQAVTGSSPILAILRFISGATAVAGSFHAVSGASIALVSPAGGKVRATNGIPSPFRIELTYTEGSSVLKPAIYDASNLPPGFNQPTKSGNIFQIRGTPTQSGVFRNVRVTGYEHSNKVGHSATVNLEITVVDGQPVITQPPVGITADAGTTATLSVAATGGSLTYQWIKEDLELPNQTGPTLTFSPLTPADAGTYRVRVQNSGGNVLSDPVTVTVNAVAQPPQFTLSPASVTVHEGEAFVLTSTATADGPITFSWTRNDQPVPDQTGSNLPFAAATPADAGSYVVRATSAGGTASALPAVVTVAASLTLGTPVPSPDGLRFPFNGIPGRTYALESSPEFVQPLWTTVEEKVASEPSEFLVAPPTGEARWYRVTGR